VSTPTGRAKTRFINAIGTSSSAARVGLRSRTTWAHSISGIAIALITKLIVVIATLPTEKLRSPKRPRGTSGSPRLRACHHRKSPSTTRPPTIIDQTSGDQSSCSPSWMPKTSRNMPAPLSATPSQSNWCGWVSSAGTSRIAITKARTPTGRLTKKIHSQLSASMMTPPRIGPTRVATPAVAPHSAIAAPRRWAGKIRVMIAIVWGVISEAPTPCATRASTRPSTVEVRPHHSEARVKTVRPVR